MWATLTCVLDGRDLVMQEGSTPLHYCAGWGIPIVCLYLLEQGADNRIRNMVRLPVHGTAVPSELPCTSTPDMTVCGHTAVTAR